PVGFSLPGGGVLAGRSIGLGLPVLAGCPPGWAFAWLVGVYEGDRFLGYLRVAAVHDPATDSLVLFLDARLLERALLLPVCLEPAWVMNHDPRARIWSGPTGAALDFGAAAPQWTRMRVLGPQVGRRLFVFNPFTAD